MADRIVSWKAIADFSAIRREAKKSVADLEALNSKENDLKRSSKDGKAENTSYANSFKAISREAKKVATDLERVNRAQKNVDSASRKGNGQAVVKNYEREESAIKTLIRQYRALVDARESAAKAGDNLLNHNASLVNSHNDNRRAIRAEEVALRALAKLRRSVLGDARAASKANDELATSLGEVARARRDGNKAAKDNNSKSALRSLKEEAKAHDDVAKAAQRAAKARSDEAKAASAPGKRNTSQEEGDRARLRTLRETTKAQKEALSVTAEAEKAVRSLADEQNKLADAQQKASSAEHDRFARYAADVEKERQATAKRNEEERNRPTPNFTDFLSANKKVQDAKRAAAAEDDRIAKQQIENDKKTNPTKGIQSALRNMAAARNASTALSNVERDRSSAANQATKDDNNATQSLLRRAAATRALAADTRKAQAARNSERNAVAAERASLPRATPDSNDKKRAKEAERRAASDKTQVISEQRLANIRAKLARDESGLNLDADRIAPRPKKAGVDDKISRLVAEKRAKQRDKQQASSKTQIIDGDYLKNVQARLAATDPTRVIRTQNNAAIEQRRRASMGMDQTQRINVDRTQRVNVDETQRINADRTQRIRPDATQRVRGKDWFNGPSRDTAQRTPTPPPRPRPAKDETTKVGGNDKAAASFASKLRDLAKANYESQRASEKNVVTQNTLGGAFRRLAPTISKTAQDMKRLADENGVPRNFASLAGAMGTTEQSSNRLRREFTGLFTSQEGLKRQAEAVTASQEKVTAADERAATSSRRVKDASDEVTYAQQRYADSLKNVVAVHNNANSSERERANSILEVSKAERDVDAATQNSSRAVRTAKKDTEAANAAHRDHASVLGKVNSAAGKLGRGLDDNNKKSKASAAASFLARKALSGLQSIMSGVVGIVAKVAAGMLKATAAIGTLIAASLVGQLISSLGVSFVALLGAIAPVVGVLNVLPALLFAVGAAAGVVALGTKGIGTAFKALGKVQEDAGLNADEQAKKQEQAAKAISSAQKGVRDAIERVADAQRAARNASEQLEAAVEGQARAERAAQDAQRASKKALDDLNKSREDATRQLQDLNAELAYSGLDEEAAVLATERAYERLQQTQAAGADASALDRKEADLAYRQSLASLEKVRVENQRLAQDTAAANAAGVEGSDQVVAAKENVANAAQAEIDANNGVRDAQRGVRDAAEGVDAAQRGVRDANEGVAEAQANLASAIRDSTEAVKGNSNAAEQAAAAMAKLSTNAQDFVLKMRGLAPAFTELRKAVQDRLFEGMGDAVVNFANIQLPVLQTGLTSIAGSLNGLGKQFLETFSSNRAVSEFQNSLANTATFFDRLQPAVDGFGRAFMSAVSGGSNFLPRLGDALSKLGETFGNFVQKAVDDGSFDRFINNAIEIAKTLGDVLQNVGSIISSVFSAGQDVGGGFLNNIKEATAAVAEFLNSAEGQDALKSFFQAFADTLHAVLPLFGQLAGIIGSTVAPALADLAQGALPGVKILIEALGKALEALAPHMGPLGAAFGKFLEALAPLLPPLGEIAGILADALSESFIVLAEAIKPVIPILGDSLLQIIRALAPMLPELIRAFTPLIGIFADLAPVLTTLIVKFIEGLMPIFPRLMDAFIQLQPTIEEIASIFTEFGAKALTDDVLPAVLAVVQAALDLFVAIAPLLPPLIDLAFRILPVFTDVMKYTGELISIVAGMIKLLSGDTEGAARIFGRIDLTKPFKPLIDIVLSSMRTMASFLRSLASAAKYIPGMGDTIAGTLNDAASSIDGLAIGVEGTVARMSANAQANAANISSSIADPVRTGFQNANLSAEAGAAEFKAKLSKGAEEGGASWNPIGKKLSDPVTGSWSEINTATDDFTSTWTGKLGIGATTAGASWNPIGKGLKDPVTGSWSEINAATDDFTSTWTGKLGGLGSSSAGAFKINFGGKIGTTVGSEFGSATSAADAGGTALGSSLGAAGSNAAGSYTGAFPSLSEPVSTGFADAIAVVAAEGGSLAAGFFETIRQIANIWQGVTGVIVFPVQTALLAVRDQAFATGDTLSGGFRLLVQQIADAWGAIYPTLTIPFQIAVDAAITIARVFFENLVNLFNGGVVSVSDAWNPIYALITDPANRIAEDLPQIFQRGFDATLKTFQAFLSTVQQLWSRLPQTMADPVNLVIDRVINNGVGRIWKITDDLVGGSLPDFQNVAPITFATGGVMPGYTPGKDPHKFVSPTGGRLELSGGEAVMRPEFTAAVGKGWVDDTNKAARNGGIAGVRKSLRTKAANYFAGGVIGGGEGGEGGAVGLAEGSPVSLGTLAPVSNSSSTGAFSDTVSAIRDGFGMVVQSLANGGVIESMTAVIKDKFPGMSITSTLRQGDPGYHGRGLAVDFSNGTDSTPGMRAAADYIATNYPQPITAQLIHQPFNRNIGQGVGDVGDGLGFYGAQTMSEHRNHVHWAANGPVPLIPGGPIDPSLFASADGASAGPSLGQRISDASQGEFKSISDMTDALYKPLKELNPQLDGIGVIGAYVRKSTELALDAIKKTVTDKLTPLEVASAGNVTLGDNSKGYAAEIYDEALKRGLGDEGAMIAFMTGFAESGMRILANPAVPESLTFPNDGLGYDHDSIGIFQQRQAGWGTTAQRMNARASAGMFFNKLQQFDWRSMDPGAAAQRVQVSAVPDAYNLYRGQAAALLAETKAKRAAAPAPNVASTSSPSRMSTGGVLDTIKYFAKGGLSMTDFASGKASKGVDRIPAMLAPGEFVMQRKAVKSLGVDTLHALNSVGSSGGSVSKKSSGAVQYFHAGGPVPGLEENKGGRAVRGLKWFTNKTWDPSASWTPELSSLLKDGSKVRKWNIPGPDWDLQNFINQIKETPFDLLNPRAVKWNFFEKYSKAGPLDMLRVFQALEQTKFTDLLANFGLSDIPLADAQKFDLASAISSFIGSFTSAYHGDIKELAHAVYPDDYNPKDDWLPKTDDDKYWTEPLTHAVEHALGLNHGRYEERPWDPMTKLEEQQKLIAVGNENNLAFRKNLDMLAVWGLKDLVNALYDMGADDGLEISKQAVASRAQAEELNAAYAEQNRVPVNVARDLTNLIAHVALTPDAGIRSAASALQVPDYAIVQLYEKDPAYLEAALGTQKLEKLKGDVARYRANTFYAATGGLVPGAVGNPASGTDTQAAMLTPGEFVVKKKIVQMLGLPFFEELNSLDGGGKSSVFSVAAPAVPYVASDLSTVNAATMSTHNVVNNTKGDTNINTIINNPVSEPSTQSMHKMLRRKATLGVFDPTA